MDVLYFNVMGTLVVCSYTATPPISISPSITLPPPLSDKFNPHHLETVLVHGANTKKFSSQVNEYFPTHSELLGAGCGAQEKLDSLLNTTQSLNVLLDAEQLGRGDSRSRQKLDDGCNALGNLPNGGTGMEIICRCSFSRGDVTLGGLVALAMAVLHEPLV